jgi:hypothetical protein
MNGTFRSLHGHIVLSLLMELKVNVDARCRVRLDLR